MADVCGDNREFYGLSESFPADSVFTRVDSRDRRVYYVPPSIMHVLQSVNARKIKVRRTGFVCLSAVCPSHSHSRNGCLLLCVM